MSAGARRQYLRVFVALAVLTAAEIGVVYVPGVQRAPMIAALVLMALAKAALVLLFFMHLGSETRVLRLGVVLPFLLPAAYSLALIGEAAWRLPP